METSSRGMHSKLRQVFDSKGKRHMDVQCEGDEETNTEGNDWFQNQTFVQC
jgi:hypothetical protein